MNTNNRFRVAFVHTLLVFFVTALCSSLLIAEELASLGGKPFEHQPEVSTTSPVFPLQFREFLQHNHIVSFYGHPGSTKMGILGEFSSLPALAEELRKYAREY
ncbi:MAG: hypothetical protein SNJ78_10330, partial [Spirochaetales bacterium]